MDDIVLGRWATLHKSHPLAAGLKQRGKLPNPAYEKALMLGRPPVTVIRKKDEATGKVTKTETPIPRFINMVEEVGNYIHVPRMMVPRTKVTRTEVSEGQPFDFKSRVTPRPYQVGFINQLEAALRASEGATGQASAGYGKTICFLEVMARLGRTAVIIVNKEFLMEQWVERILGTEQMMERLQVKTPPSEVYQPAFGIKPEEVGIVRGKKCEWEGRGVVIAMAQSLVARAYSPEFYEYFGLVGVDEVHNFAAPTFQSTVVMFPARYRLGVTATPERKDGLQDVFFNHIGPVSAVGIAPRVAPRVNQVRTPVVWTDRVEKDITRFGRPDFNKLLDFLCTHEARNRQIVRLAAKAAGKGRKFIVLSQRREHLETLMSMFTDECREQGVAASFALYMGGMKKDERKQAEKMQGLFATFSMAKEALDIPALDTLFMVTPVTEVEQAVGRIQREYTDKKTPVVVDFVDAALKTCSRSAAEREREYRRLGWKTDAAA